MVKYLCQFKETLKVTGAEERVNGALDRGHEGVAAGKGNRRGRGR